jgi:hypothetical protein
MTADHFVQARTKTMKANFVSQADIEAAHTEAAICAEGTLFTADDLYSLWADACAADDYAYDPRSIYEEALRRPPLV